MQSIFVIIVFSLLYFLRLPGLLAKEYRRDLVVFTLLIFIAFIISILAILGVKFPYVTTEIMKAFKAIFHLTSSP